MSSPESKPEENLLAPEDELEEEALNNVAGGGGRRAVRSQLSGKDLEKFNTLGAEIDAKTGWSVPEVPTNFT